MYAWEYECLCARMCKSMSKKISGAGSASEERYFDM